MTKRELIDSIQSFNTSANAGFLAQFNQRELCEYHEALQQAREAHARARAQKQAGAVPGFRSPARPPSAPAQAVSVEISPQDFILPGQGKLF